MIPRPHHRGQGRAAAECGIVAAAYDRRDNSDEDETAQRLAAAWNACEGIPTERLTPGLLAEMRDALRSVLQFYADAGPPEAPPMRWEEWDAKERSLTQSACDLLAKLD